MLRQHSHELGKTEVTSISTWKASDRKLFAHSISLFCFAPPHCSLAALYRNLVGPTLPSSHHCIFAPLCTLNVQRVWQYTKHGYWLDFFPTLGAWCFKPRASKKEDLCYICSIPSIAGSYVGPTPDQCKASTKRYWTDIGASKDKHWFDKGPALVSHAAYIGPVPSRAYVGFAFSSTWDSFIMYWEGNI